MPEQKLILSNAPIHRDRFAFIERQDGFHVAEIDNDESVIRIARDLVHRYNVHEQLVAACQYAERWISDMCKFSNTAHNLDFIKHHCPLNGCGIKTIRAAIRAAQQPQDQS